MEETMLNITVIWRGKQLNMELSPNCNFEELGKKLQKLTSVEPYTMRLLVPQSSKTSKVITPFSDEHSCLSLQEMAIVEEKPIRMMGVFDDEIEEVSQNSMKPDLRIAGFDEEEKRLKQRSGNGPRASLKLPQGAYIFCDFRTLHIPGIELTPPPSEALRRMHMLASDPGIVAIMNKHRWRVGVMTEMAPEGYVGISPKCLLGFNKNHGEEISLRLRTDDLKGFRKYASIKKTLLHELAHMVYSEHDSNFYTLDNQLNQEAASLDWTKSRSHTLSGHKISENYDEDIHFTETNYSGQKLGGGMWNSLATARASSVAAAYNRFLNASTNDLDGFQVPAEGVDTNRTTGEAHQSLNKEQLPDAATEPDPDDGELKGGQVKMHAEPDPDDVLASETFSQSSMHTDNEEPDPDECPDSGRRMFEPDPDDTHAAKAAVSRDEPDPYDSEFGEAMKASDEPDPDDSISNMADLIRRNIFEPDPDDSAMSTIVEDESGSRELQRIEEPVAAICTRLQKAIENLRYEATPTEATTALQTLFKIIRNVINHPDEVKFRRLRKANPQFRRNVANHKAAMEVLAVAGFHEDVISDEFGRAETYLVLKRNDPGLLWLAKSSLELSTA